MTDQDYGLNILIEGIKNCDHSCFKEFFHIMQPSIFRFIYRYTSDSDSAADLTQETFIKFWLNRDKLNLSLSPKSYLYRIARNLSINYITRRPPVSNLPDNEDFLIEFSRNPYKDYDNLFLLDEFQKAINLLPERCRATFILSRYDGFEYSEIADIMQVSLQTVKNQMNKALSILRKCLASHLE